MPMSHTCAQAGCPAVVKGRSRCPIHARDGDRQRGTAQERGYNAAWGKARAAYLLKHPICVTCEQRRDFRPATVVDHIVPHRGDKRLFWDSENWQALCATCHGRKTGSGQ